MIIRCVKCKKEFDRGSTSNRRICDDIKCKPLVMKSRLSRHYQFFTFMGSMKRYFQNPIYQYLRLGHSESLNNDIQYGSS